MSSFRLLFRLAAPAALSLTVLAQAPAPTMPASSASANPAGATATVPKPEPVFPMDAKEKDVISAPMFPSKNFLRRHFVESIPKFELRAPAKFEDFSINNQLELSLRSYLQLVLANNVEVDINRLSVELQRNAITRAYAPFDPFLLGSYASQTTKTPTTNSLEGAATLDQNNQPTNFTVNQTLSNGLQYTAGFNASRLSTNNSFNFFNPALNSQMSISAVLPLLRNRGTAINRLPITIARSRLRSGEQNFLANLLRIVATAESAYWDVIGARDSLRVQEKSLELSNEALKRSKRELELGAISPLDIYQPEANYASAEIQVLQARYRLQQAEDALRRQMGADLDSRYKNMPIVLTETVLPSLDGSEIDREGSVEKALRLRPDLKAIVENIYADDLGMKQAANGLRPDLSLRGAYTSTGRGGDFFPRGANNVILPVVKGGFFDALDQMFGFGFPIYSFGVNLRLPLRDRAAAANFADAVVNKRLDVLRKRSQEQTIRQEVLNAISQVESSKASVKLASVARDFAQKQLDAEQKKYDLGTSVIFFVLDAQTRLVAAENQLVNQSVQYRRNLVNLFRVTGELLDERGIRVQE